MSPTTRQSVDHCRTLCWGPGEGNVIYGRCRGGGFLDPEKESSIALSKSISPTCSMIEKEGVFSEDSLARID
jgi:hypothetical protein